MKIHIVIKGVVNRFDGKGGWYFVRIPKKDIPKNLPKNRNGFIPATFILGSTSWESSLLPMGDGDFFIALKKEVRKAESVDVGDDVRVQVYFTV